MTTVKVYYDNEFQREVTADLTPQIEQIKARNARTGYAQSDASIEHEVAFKIYGPDFDADEAEWNRWSVEVA